MSVTVNHGLLKTVSRFEVTMAHSGLLEIFMLALQLGLLTQKKGKDPVEKNLLIVNVRFNGYPFGGRR